MLGTFTDADVAWQAASAIATLFAAIVALSLPFIQAGLRQRKSRLMILQEVDYNLEILSWVEERFAEDGSWRHFEEDMKWAADEISTEAWKTFRYELSISQTKCIGKAYHQIERFANPDSRIKGVVSKGVEQSTSASFAADIIRELRQTCKHFAH